MEIKDLIGTAQTIDYDRRCEGIRLHRRSLAQIGQKVREHFHLQSDGNANVEIPVSDENYEDMPESLLEELEKDDAIPLEEYAQE